MFCMNVIQVKKCSPYLSELCFRTGKNLRDDFIEYPHVMGEKSEDSTESLFHYREIPQSIFLY